MAGTALAWLTLVFFGFAASATARLALAELHSRPGEVSPSEVVRANPRASAAWIELGLAAESAGKLRDAELDLIEAAHVDRQYLPAWTLANFYFRHPDFRHDDAAAFWHWAERAASLAYDDVRPLLRLCDAMDPDPGDALDRLANHPPAGRRYREPVSLDDGTLRRAYLDFLIGENRLDAAQVVARRMLLDLRPGDTARLVGFVDRQIAAGNGAAALEIWDRLRRPPRLDRRDGGIAGRLRASGLPGSKLPRNSLAGIVNGDLETAPTGTGFDWRMPPSEGLTAEWIPSRLRFVLSGSEPETCGLLEQELVIDTPRSDLAQPATTSSLRTPAVSPQTTPGASSQKWWASPGIETRRNPIEDGRRGPAQAQYRLSFEYATAGLPSPTGLRWKLCENGTLGENESPILAPSERWREAEWLISRLPPVRQVRLRLFYRRVAGTIRAEGRFDLRHIRLEVL